MFELVPFKKEHLAPLMLEKINSHLPNWVRDGHAAEMEKHYSRTILASGEILVCGGVTELWANRGALWTIFSERSRPRFVSVFRGMQKFLNEAPFKRIEISIPCAFENGHRRAKMLGFELECPLAKAFSPDGEDHALYAFVRGN